MTKLGGAGPQGGVGRGAAQRAERGAEYGNLGPMDQRMTEGAVPEHARRAEALVYDGLNVPDAAHEGLLIAHAARAATSRLRVVTSVLLAFPRIPMNVAHASWDLQDYSGGCFELGLGSRVRGNIVGRFSANWSPRFRA